MHLGWLIAASAGSALVTLACIRYARRRGLLDQPGARRSHRVPTPRGGGIGIVLMLSLALLVASNHALSPLQPLVMLGGLLGVAWIGWVDDHRSLGVLERLAVHLAASLALAWALVGSPTSLDLLLALLLALTVVAAINFCNFMDGINGLAGSQAALVAAALAILFGAGGQGEWAWIAAVLAAACLGFLPFNLPRARVFLGDVGSGALGFAVAALLLLAWTQHLRPWPALLLLPSAFVLDAGLTLLSRMLHGRRWYRPHREHLYQWWVRRGRSHAAVTAAYAAWTTAMAALVLCNPDWNEANWTVTAIGIHGLGALIWWQGRRQLLRGAARRRAR